MDSEKEPTIPQVRPTMALWSLDHVLVNPVPPVAGERRRKSSIDLAVTFCQDLWRDSDLAGEKPGRPRRCVCSQCVAGRGNDNRALAHWDHRNGVDCSVRRRGWQRMANYSGTCGLMRV